MSVVYERLKIGVDDGEQVKEITNLDLDNLTYDLVDDGGEVFPAEQGVAALEVLRKGLPEVHFLIMSGE